MPTYFRYDSWVKSVLGQAVAGAQIWVCTQPANVTPPVTPPRTTPVPWAGPNPQAPIFSDPNGVSLVTQPLLSDGFGHYNFYAAPGIYTVVVYNQGKLQNFYPDQSLGNISTNTITGTSILFETNGVADAQQLLRNLVSTPSVSVATDGSGNTTFGVTGTALTLKTNGVVNGNQFLLNLQDGAGVHITQDGAGNVAIINTAIPIFKTNGVTNGNQSLLNLVNGTGINITQDGSGNTTINSTITPLLLKTNGTTNGSQSLLNLLDGTGIHITQDGSGNTTVNSTLALKTNGVTNGSQTLLNLVDGTGTHITQDGVGNVTINNTSTLRTGAIIYTIDGGGSVITTGAKGQLDIPLNCTVTGWVLTADQSGSAVVDVLRSSYAGFPSTSSIAGSDKPTLSSVQKNENLSIGAWGSTALLAGDQLQFNVNSATTVQRLNLALIVTMTG
jgi:hypothetical protein